MRIAAITVIAVLGMCVCSAQLVNISEEPVRLDNLSPPISISAAHAGLQPPDWASSDHKNPQNMPSLSDGLPLYMQVANNGSKTVRAYRIMIATYDPFGGYLDTIRTIAVASISPKSSDYGRWTLPLRYRDSTMRMVMYPNAVIFDDGSEWRLDAHTAAAYIAFSTTVRFETWHIMARPQEVLPVKMKDVVMRQGQGGGSAGQPQ